MPDRDKEGSPRNAVVVGCGRVGALIAGELSRSGCGVIVVDRSEKAFENLPPEFSGFPLAGDAVEMNTLRSARLEKADCLVAVTRDDNVNLMVAHVARIVFRVPRVLARVSDPRKEPVFNHFGIEVVSTTRVTAENILSMISPGKRR